MDKWTRASFDLTNRDTELRANLKSSFSDFNLNFGFSYLINTNTNGENDNYVLEDPMKDYCLMQFPIILEHI